MVSSSWGSATRRGRVRIDVAIVAVFMMVAAVLGTASAGAVPGDDAQSDAGAVEAAALVPRPVPPKPAVSVVSEGYSNEILHLKLHEGSQARLSNGVLTAAGEPRVAEVNATLAQFPGTVLQRMFTRPVAELTAEKARIEARSGRQQADKSLWFRVRLADGTDAVAVINALNSLDIVEIAYAEPLPAPPPVTPNFEPQQGYLDPAPTGIDADFAKTMPGGLGQNVKIIDIEYSWNDAHEDLASASGQLIPNGTPCDFFNDNNHGTAVLGELIGTANGIGVTGVVPGAAIGMVNAARSEPGCTYRLAEAIDLAHNNLVAGDLILLEQQAFGPQALCTGQGGTQEGLVAVEWVQAYYDSIVAATSDGIIVVEAAGNGSCNFDDAAYGNPFPAGRPDSGAIIVGAGSAPGGTLPLHSRLGFSGHGTRVDVQGYGQNVVTTGYGGLHTGAGVNEWYTATFGGTSGASPIVTGAAAVLSSLAQQSGTLLTSPQVRAILKATGTAQTFGLAGNIGPLPNLAAAVGQLCSTTLLAANDNLANAATLTGAADTDMVPNQCATAEAGEVTHDNAGGQPPSHSVWWQWTAPANGPVTVDTEGSALLPSNDTVLGVYTGNAVNALTVIGKDDDGGTGLLSKVDFVATAGTTYKIAVDSWRADRSGLAKVNINQAPPVGLCNGLAPTLMVPPGGANFFGTAGNDVIMGTPGVDNIFGIGGNDTICGLGGDDNLNGGNGNDWISGGDGNDFVGGQGQVDTVMGDAGNDQVVGGIGNDILHGGPGIDLMRGQGNDDTINGDGDVDVIFGGSGNDIINTGPGANRGFDCTAAWGATYAACPVTGNGNNDTITGSGGNDELGGQNGLDTVNGGAGDDLLTGGLGADTLNGQAGNDTLQGQGSADTLNGGNDNDSLSGGAGAPDRCNGDAGVDSLADGTCEIVTGVP